MTSQKTFSQKPADVAREWFIIDAAKVPLGRLATVVSDTLVGKKKVTYTPHTDGGDYVVVINSDSVALTGNKEGTKPYYRHSGYPGNLRTRTAGEQRQKDSRKIIQAAVSGMLPKNKLARIRMDRLKVYTGQEHNHDPQKPKPLSLSTVKKTSGTNPKQAKVQTKLKEGA